MRRRAVQPNHRRLLRQGPHRARRGRRRLRPGRARPRRRRDLRERPEPPRGGQRHGQFGGPGPAVRRGLAHVLLRGPRQPLGRRHQRVQPKGGLPRAGRRADRRRHLPEPDRELYAERAVRVHASWVGPEQGHEQAGCAGHDAAVRLRPTHPQRHRWKSVPSSVAGERRGDRLRCEPHPGPGPVLHLLLRPVRRQPLPERVPQRLQAIDGGAGHPRRVPGPDVPVRKGRPVLDGRRGPGLGEVRLRQGGQDQRRLQQRRRLRRVLPLARHGGAS
mmetsp:Transcript_28971/g.87628  ORF Transcript_28971/g.87628 Transcript_28971/m.87628 type:complete len:274 (+) Transcript_28971:1619-2440(+)